MANKTSMTELRKMNRKDLMQEIAKQGVAIAKLKMGVKLGKEKDTAKYQREKKQFARMCTVLSEAKKSQENTSEKKESSVSSSSK